MKYCQSCSMPLNDGALCGTNQDQSRREEYCIYCFKDGQFTKDCTMDEMIELCARFVDEYNQRAGTYITREQYIKKVKTYFPELKRWKKDVPQEKENSK